MFLALFCLMKKRIRGGLSEKLNTHLKRAIKESKVETCFQTQKLHSVPFTLRTSTITRLKRLKRRYLLSYSIPLLTG